MGPVPVAGVARGELSSTGFRDGRSLAAILEVGFHPQDGGRRYHRRMTQPVVWQTQMDAVLARFADDHPFGYGNVRLEPAGVELDVLVAETREQKALGMTGREFAPWDGMVFIEPVSTTARWHMGGVTEPIVLALFDDDGRFVWRGEMVPGQVDETVPERPFRYALELPAGLEAASMNLEEARLVVEARSFSDKERQDLAKEGHAMPDGSFPIVTPADLKNAIQAYGRAGDKAAAKRHIIKRARQLGKTDMLPEGWA